MPTEQRIRDLASDDRAGRFVRGEVRRHQREFVRRHWRMLAGTTTAVLLGTTLAALLAPNQFERGLLVGFGLAAAIAIDIHFTVVLTGSGPRGMGELAEQWTAQELRPLLDHGWRLVNHVSLNDRGDMDHVLVGPGGLLVLETKWSATGWRVEPPDSMLAAAAGSVEKAAARLSLVLRRHIGVQDASPLVVLWGRAAINVKDSPTPSPIPGYASGVIAGSRIREWALRRGRTQLTPEQVDAVWAELDRYAGYTDRREDAIPDSFAAMSRQLVSAVTVGLAAFVAIAELSRRPHGWLIGITTSATLLIAAVTGRRHQRTPAVVLPSLLGVATSAAAALLLWAVAGLWTVFS